MASEKPYVSQRAFIRNGYQVVETITRTQSGKYQAAWTVGGSRTLGGPCATEAEATKATESAFDSIYK